MTNTPPESIEQYSPQDIEEAKKEIADLTPEDYLALRAYVDGLDAQENLHEAGFIVFTELRSPNSGAALNITVRSSNPIDGLDGIAAAMRYARDKYGLLPVQKHSAQKPTPQPNVDQTVPHAPATRGVADEGNGLGKVTQSAPHAPAAPKAPAREPVYTDEGTQEGTKGTSILNKISVQEGKVEFYVGKFKYPFKDARGAAVVASLFDPELGWTEEHFKTKAAIYTPEDWGNMVLHVDWEKPAKYYNVVRIHA